jgi:hypothetical protein
MMYAHVLRYSPDQPRAPVGTTEGGQFISSGAVTATDEEVGAQVAAEVAGMKKMLGLPNMWISAERMEELKEAARAGIIYNKLRTAERLKETEVVNAISESHRQYIQEFLVDEKDALDDYTRAGFRHMNRAIVDPSNPRGDEIKAFWLKRAQVLNAAVAAKEIETDLTTYRAVTAGRGQALGMTPQNVEEFVGKTIESKAMSSTAIKRSKAIEFSGLEHKTLQEKVFLLAINVKKGQKGLYVGGMSKAGNETELILPVGSKFTVRKVYRAKGEPVVVGVDLSQ